MWGWFDLLFSAPLWVVSSSGTTGIPEPIGQSPGGMLIAHLKRMAFHRDLGVDDRFFWYSSCGWRAWPGSLPLPTPAARLSR